MTLVPTELDASQNDLDGVVRAALDYIEGYVEGGAERHARAYHPECTKRRLVADEESGIYELVVLSPRTMADYAARTRIEECESEIVIDATSQEIASVGTRVVGWTSSTSPRHAVSGSCST